MTSCAEGVENRLAVGSNAAVVRYQHRNAGRDHLPSAGTDEVAMCGLSSSTQCQPEGTEISSPVNKEYGVAGDRADVIVVARESRLQG